MEGSTRTVGHLPSLVLGKPEGVPPGGSTEGTRIGCTASCFPRKATGVVHPLFSRAVLTAQARVILDELRQPREPRRRGNLPGVVMRLLRFGRIQRAEVATFVTERV